MNKDGSPRFCLDYRELTCVSHADRWLLPRVDQILEDMRGSSVSPTIDLFQRYWQRKMDETCEEKAAFICRYGKFIFEAIAIFARIARPFNEKTSENVKFVCSEAMQTAFEELKVKLTSAPVLAHPRL